jgi:hypothetical protein
MDLTLIVSVPHDQFGFLGGVLSGDQSVSSARTHVVLDWRPVQPGLIADMESGYYFPSV